jgi:hypothetical protein
VLFPSPTGRAFTCAGDWLGSGRLGGGVGPAVGGSRDWIATARGQEGVGGENVRKKEML